MITSQQTNAVNTDNSINSVTTNDTFGEREQVYYARFSNQPNFNRNYNNWNANRTFSNNRNNLQRNRNRYQNNNRNSYINNNGNYNTNNNNSNSNRNQSNSTEAKKVYNRIQVNAGIVVSAATWKLIAEKRGMVQAVQTIIQKTREETNRGRFFSSRFLFPYTKSSL